MRQRVNQKVDFKDKVMYIEINNQRFSKRKRLVNSGRVWQLGAHWDSGRL